MCAVWFGISFGWYGTVLWFPSYFAARAAAAPTDADAAALLSPPPPALHARPAPLDARPFADQLAVAFANLPGNVLSVVMIDAWGRRATLAAGLSAGALCALAFAAVPRNANGAALAAACAFNGASVGAWNALDTYRRAKSGKGSAHLCRPFVRTDLTPANLRCQRGADAHGGARHGPGPDVRSGPPGCHRGTVCQRAPAGGVARGAAAAWRRRHAAGAFAYAALQALASAD
jgi:hypothetical protein